MQLDTALRQSIVRICDVPAEQVSEDATLDSLGIDSLTAAEIITDLEIRLNRELPMDVLRRLGQVRTVSQIAAELRATLGSGAVQL